MCFLVVVNYCFICKIHSEILLIENCKNKHCKNYTTLYFNEQCETCILMDFKSFAVMPEGISRII